MMLSGDPKFPARRTYVVKFRSEATPGALRGRLENLVTCTQNEFASEAELLAVIVRDLEASAVEPSGDS